MPLRLQLLRRRRSSPIGSGLHWWRRSGLRWWRCSRGGHPWMGCLLVLSRGRLRIGRWLACPLDRRAISDAAWRSVGCAALWRPSFRGAAALLLHRSPPARLLHRVGGELEVTRPCEGHGEATRLRRGEEQLSEQVPDRRARGGVGKIGKSRHEEVFGQGTGSVVGCRRRRRRMCRRRPGESATGRSWPPQRHGRSCRRPVRQYDGEHHQPRTITWSQGGAHADLAWRQ